MTERPRLEGATLGARLRSARDALGLTQERVAAAVGITRAAVGRFETGEATPTIATCAQLAEALGVRAGWVAFGEEPPRATG